MRKILLATALLSIAASENILMENHPKLKTAWICDKQLWNRKTKRISRKDIPSKMEDFLNYEDDGRFSRISDTLARFIGDSRKLPSMIIRPHGLARFSQDDLSIDNNKPKVFISIGIQGEKNAGNDLQEDCSKRRNYCNQDWQLQQPFYVEEPTWVDIDNDYMDSFQHVNNGDPYILTRGKKFHGIKEQEGKTVEDYKANLGDDSSSNNKKGRVRRSAKANERSQDKMVDMKNNQMKEGNHYDSLEDESRDINNAAIIEMKNKGEKSFKIRKTSEERPKDTSYVFIKKHEKDLKNLGRKFESTLRRFEFTKRNQIFVNKIIDLIEQRQKIKGEDVPNDIETDSSRTAKIDRAERFDNSKSHSAISTNNKESVSLKNQKLPTIRKKRESYEIDANSKKDIENDTYEQMRTKVYVRELNGRDTPDNHFILPRDKNPFHDGIENLNNKDMKRGKSTERAWKLHYARRKRLEEDDGEARNEENRFKITEDNTEMTDTQLINEPNSKNSEVKTPSYRGKRNVCKACKIKSQNKQDEWLKDIEKKIQESLALERRDKHRDVLEHLSEPYIISRGKKDFEKGRFSSISNSRYINDRVETMNLPIVESLLRMLSKETSECSNDCDINANRLSIERLSSRDRRGISLDEIFTAYDPFYVVRGK